jgi:hypothetical protein
MGVRGLLWRVYTWLLPTVILCLIFVIVVVVFVVVFVVCILSVRSVRLLGFR